ITVTDSWMSTMSKDQIAVCRVDDGAILNGKQPSKEIGFHAGILQERSDVNVVLHYQSPYATTLSCRQRRQTPTSTSQIHSSLLLLNPPAI
ncbi:class II aldolase/adducin family protein, partial [Planctomycetota bacterium]